MPLTAPQARRRYHTRQIETHGYYRQDGLWDIEGHMVDEKSYPFENYDRGVIGAGNPIHNMWLRLTVDDDLVIQSVESSMDATPYQTCGGAQAIYQAAVGLRIGPGLRKALRERVGSGQGCTHISELFWPLATVAFQTIYVSRDQARKDAGLPPYKSEKNKTKKNGDAAASSPSSSRAGSFLLNSCHSFRASSPVIEREYPHLYEPDAGAI